MSNASLCRNTYLDTTRATQKDFSNHLPWDYNLYRDLPVKIVRYELFENSPMFDHHWHEQMQIFYFEKGEATILCNANTYILKPRDVLIINSNEIHYGMTHSEHVIYHIIKPDFNFLSSCQLDFCQTKYITPLLQGDIRFQNQILQDIALTQIINKIITEHTGQEIGFELSIKADIYHIIVHLLRHYQQQSLAANENRQQKALHHLRSVLEYMDEHYTEKIRLNKLANLANMSSQNFCRIFKKLTGKSPMDYINCLRINKAAALLLESDYNISEIASAVGFDDSNYFSRTFKKYRKTSPSALRKQS